MDFTHFDSNGSAYMVDISQKDDTSRIAIATGKIKVSSECFNKIKAGEIGKGDVLSVARIAGIMGTKRCSDLIPLCHNINISKSLIDFEMDDEKHEIKAVCTVKTVGKTGVEMEALTGVNVALLTIYDMCKAIDKRMVISDIHLEQKQGGKSGDFKY